jgi:arylsulfatase A-like enzyme
LFWNLEQRNANQEQNMKLLHLSAICLLLSLFGAAMPAQSQSESDRPNFLVVYGEGSGWVSTSVQMDEGDPLSKSDYIETPNLERMAADGVVFSRGYAPSPRCTPSRAGLYTGISPAKLHMTYTTSDGLESRNQPENMRIVPPAPITELPTERTTYAEILQQTGYGTAHFGKWHLGRVDPTGHGFDESDGANSNDSPSGRDFNQAEYIVTAEKGIDFMRRQVAAGRPFLLEVDHYPIMINRNVPEEMAAERLAMDASFGLMYDALEELGIANNTYVIFSADHGTQGRLNTPLQNGKGSILEGGLRVPFIISGPYVRSGEWSDIPVTALDIFPTIAELSGNTNRIGEDVEGGSLVSILRDKAGEVVRSREEIVFHFPHYDLGNAGPATALLFGDYKLVKNYELQELLLYNIADDPGETNDLAAAMPDLVAELDEKLVTYLEEVDAAMPTPNPEYR